ncbi:MAG: GAF domain-containing protein [Acidobacteriota bacterium]
MAHDVHEDDPVLDPARLREILDLDLVAEQFDPELQKLVAEAANALDLPIGLVTVVLDDAQYFAAMYGVEGWLKEARGTPVEWAFCTHVVRTGEPLVVGETADHPKTRHSPLVYEESVRSYAAVPLRTERDQVIGSLCVVGDRAHDFDADDIDYLTNLARRVLVALEARRVPDDVGGETQPPI